MQVKDVMTKSCVTARTSDTLEQAAKTMRDRDVGVLPVIDGGRAVGVITDRDIAMRAVAEGRPPGVTPVGDVMTAGVTYCRAESDIREALKIMGTERVRRLPVADLKGDVVGMISLSDAARAASSGEPISEALGEICARG